MALKCEHSKYLKKNIVIFYIFCSPKVIELHIDDMKIPYFQNINSNSSAKLAFFMTKDMQISLGPICRNSSSRVITPDFFYKFPQSIWLYKMCVLHDLLHDVMERILPAGIPQYIWKYEQENRFSHSGLRTDDDDEDTRRVFSLHDLEYGFVLWLIACGISTVVFLIEYLRPKLKKFVRTSTGLLCFLRLLRARLDQFYT
jgi:hypothetical protein